MNAAPHSDYTEHNSLHPPLFQELDLGHFCIDKKPAEQMQVHLTFSSESQRHSPNLSG